MKSHKFFPALAACLAVASSVANIATAHAATGSSSHSTPASPAAPAPGVLINAVTRNDKQSDTTLELARDNQALMPIVLSAKASDATKALAAEFAEYLKRITGATFSIETGDGSKGIVVGSMPEFDLPAFAKSLEIFNGIDGREAFAIRTRPGKLMLIGATEMGTSHAIWRFMETLGYRHFFPHSAWEVVPSTPDLKWNRDITDRPQMLNRTIWFEAGSGTAQAEKDYDNWKRHNLVAQSLHVNISGGGMMLPKEIMDAHPEYWAARKQPDGSLKRDPGSYQLELANPAVRKLLVDQSIKAFKDNPNFEMVNLDPADTTAHSESPESLAMGSVSDRVFGVANEVAKALQKEFPGQNKMVGLLSYNSYYDPPSFPMEPNVHVQMASIGMNPKYSGPERAKIWGQRSKNLGVYEYYSVWAWSHDSLLNGYVEGVHNQQKHIRDELVGRGVISMSAESTSSWGSLGRGYYVANKLMWNPNLDLNALLDDFYQKAFGPAAPMMKKYYERLDPDNGPLMSASLLGNSFRDINEASKAAADRPDVMARLDQLKLYLRYVDLMWHRDNEGATVNSDDIMANLARTREYALTSWEMIRQNWGGGKYPGAPDAPAWMADKLYTHEEIEKDFQEGLARYEPKIRDVGPRLKYSTDLVAINWPGIKPEQNNVAGKQTYQGSMKYAFYSVDGAPIEFNTFAGDAWGYKTSWQFVDKNGKELASGKPDAKVLLPHKIAIPAPGLYYLIYSDPGAYWTFTAKPGTLYSLEMLPESPLGRSTEFQDMYLYVPKGTKTLVYFNQGGGHTVIGPDESTQAQVAANDYAQVPVPAGMDGKLWKLHNVSLGRIYFYNVPSYLAPTPEGLLVPREIAQKDGLTIRN